MKSAAALACVLAALAFAGTSGAGGNHDLVAGGGVQTLNLPDFGVNETDEYSVGATSDPDGTNPRGEVHVTTDAFGGGKQSFTGDVRDGCLLVAGNRATAIGELPESQQFVAENGQLVKYLAVTVQDNGNGDGVDQASAILLFERSGERACAGTVVLPTYPLDHGNFVVDDAS